MIRSISVSNYRSLGPEVQFDLGRLTVLVGQNGSGKSNVVDVFKFLADCLRLSLESAITKRHGIGGVRRWSKGRPFNVKIGVEVRSDPLEATYEFELAGDRAEDYRVKFESAHVSTGGVRHGYRIEHQADGPPTWVSGPPSLRPNVDRLNLVLPLIAGDDRFRPLADELGGIALYSIYPDVLRRPQKYDPKKPMDRYGSNWVSILRDQPEDSWKPDLVSVLGKLTGDIIDVRVRPVGGYLTTEFRHKSEPNRQKWFETAQESDGTLRVAGMITALCQKPVPSLLAVEEPELTVHPGALPMLYEFFEEASHTTQVVLTTHSPDLLESLQTQDVRVVERRQGQTTIQPLNEGQRQVVQEGLFSLGEVLRSDGLRQQPLFSEGG